MGIPRFFGWLKKQNYEGVLQDSLPGEVDWLIFDTNSLFHQAQQITYAYGDHFTVKRAKEIRSMTPEQLEKEFRETLMTLISNVVFRVRPREGILIAVDGVSPQAKIQQQRQRRYKGPRTSDRDDDESEMLPPEIQELKKPIIDVNRITPGTEFMFRLDDFLRDWLGINGDKKPRNTLQWGVTRIIYSSHLVPGEGEHKYLELLREGRIPSQGVHVINGMDADLFILSLVAPVERIFITREDIEQVVSIQNFRNTLFRLMKQPSTPLDFALLTFFIGNDFLPHQPSLHDMKKSIDTLIATYVKVNKPLTEKTEEGTRIIWENLAIFLKEFIANEQTLIANEAVRGFKYPSTAMDEALSTDVTKEELKSAQEQSKNIRSGYKNVKKHTFDFNVFRNQWYQSALGPRGDTTVLDFLMNRPAYQVTVDRIVEHGINYLRGLAWNLAYYADGWYGISLEYVYPYHHTPLFVDLAEIAASKKDELNEGLFESQEDYDFNPIHQLLAVLPFESQNLLPPEVKFMMDIDSPIYDMYPNQFVIDREGTNYKWEGIAIISFSESDRIVNAVATVDFPRSTWDKYQPVDDEVVTFRKEEVDLIRKQRDQMAKIQRLFPSTRGRGRGKQVSVPSRGERVSQPSKTQDWKTIKL